jgi:hypothetical protein
MENMKLSLSSSEAGRKRLEAQLAGVGKEEGELAKERALRQDPGVIRRLGLAVPVRIEVQGGAEAQEMADALDAKDWQISLTWQEIPNIVMK